MGSNSHPIIIKTLCNHVQSKNCKIFCVWVSIMGWLFPSWTPENGKKTQLSLAFTYIFWILWEPPSSAFFHGEHGLNYLHKRKRKVICIEFKHIEHMVICVILLYKKRKMDSIRKLGISLVWSHKKWLDFMCSNLHINEAFSGRSIRKGGHW